jgi:1-acyl-sn-glycerol-3-phosphate acyltransferase
LQRIARRLLRGSVRRLWPLQLSGSSNVPSSGAAILCPNHLSFFDSVFMMMTLDRPVHFIGKADYLSSWKTRRLFPALGMIPIDRDSGIRAMVALDAAADVLRQGALLCVFPEGSRSRDGLLHRGYPGAARLAMSVDCPIVPVGITGTDRIQPPGARLPRPGRGCSISIGAPIDPPRTAIGHKMAARTMTDQVMRLVAGLSGQDYVACYTQRSAPSHTGARADRRHRPMIGASTPIPGAA